MAYVKQNFKSGETLYALQLNAMDKQIAANEAATERLKEEKANQADLAKTADKLNTMDKQVVASVAETSQLKEDIAKTIEKVKPGEATVKDGYLIGPNGELIDNETSTAHTKIFVHRGTKIRIENAYCAYSRSICAYTSDGKLVKTLATNLGTAIQTLEFDVDNYDMIGITSKLGEQIMVTYVGGNIVIPLAGFCAQIDEKNQTADGTGNYYMSNITLNQDEFTDGYLASGSIIESSTLHYSPYIPVLDEQTVRLKNIFVSGFTEAVFYDKNKKFIGYSKSDTTYYDATVDVTIP